MLFFTLTPLVVPLMPRYAVDIGAAPILHFIAALIIFAPSLLSQTRPKG
jgi:hypothetical protein